MAKSPSPRRGEGRGEGQSDRAAGSGDRSPSTARAVTLAVVTGAHGVGGEVRLKVFADDLSAHRSFNAGTLTARSIRVTPQGAIARFAEVADRTAAEALRGTELTVPRDTLPPLGDGEYYHADLLGLPAVSEAGETIGAVVAIDNFGAGDVIEIERTGGGRFMVPMNAQAVPDWNDQRLVVADGWAE
ncbi:ribosome maturation factor RimM [Sphingomonas donggukensis]|uniref:Ribosome maturation factor RimM n=1 Tax=Sphingomonas donggukensis TaxID=2949093 RepID=A0ABY4TWG7_9SPHN|nr:ribosome maturation factor RimM [Sphingomonas donggukensis]URW76727.1 ribosome maturation factor RimM [Sphingomonas donggukensis]